MGSHLFKAGHSKTDFGSEKFEKNFRDHAVLKGDVTQTACVTAETREQTRSLLGYKMAKKLKTP